jgi:SAM-dependent methyltransferase
MHLVHRRSCRVCGSTALTKVIDLGEQYLQGSFVKPGKEVPPTRRIPTVLVRCDPTIDERACGLLQLSKTLPPEVLYSAYWYRSGTNQTMRDHLRGIADDAAALCGRARARVLDIGCNDGTLLKAYPESFARFGVDPSDIAREVSHGITVVQDLFPSEELGQVAGDAPFDIITSIAMFYDLEDPLTFVRRLKKHLAPEGLWVFEMSYMPSMLANGSYDTICHEHLEYYSLAVIEYLLKQADMKLIKAELNDVNGGSIRCYASHVTSFSYKSAERQQGLAALRREEFDLALDTDKPYREFQARMDKHKQQLVSLLRDLKSQGKTIHIYGASTKGNTILQFCGIDRAMIDCAAERNPDKYGAETLGTGIPIVSEAESRSRKPDYYLVLPWHFREEFLIRERDTLAAGVGLIFPLPTVEIVTRATVAAGA